jgi:hypothetical protein
MPNYVQKILNLSNQLYPTGRAFKNVVGGWRETLHRALAYSENEAYSAALSTFDSAIPDNSNFTADDAADWEKRLGIVTGNTDLETRKMAIRQKLNYPGLTKARGNYRFVEKQLRDAGFDVYVYENRFPDGMGGYVTQDPVTIAGIGSLSRHGEINHGEANHGPYFSNIVANFLDEDKDNNFNFGTNLRSTFFICGPNIGDYASVPLVRKEEFRHLILRLKPAQTVAFLFINYT